MLDEQYGSFDFSPEIIKFGFIYLRDFIHQTIQSEKLALLDEIVEDIVGIDEVCNCKNVNCPVNFLNDLRSDQRAKPAQMRAEIEEGK